VRGVAVDPDAQGQTELVANNFGRSMRVRKRGDFVAAQTRGQKVSGSVLVLLLLRTAGTVARLGITVSSRVGNSVVRSRLKRWIRELVRTHRSLLPPGHDVIVVARPVAAKVEHRQLDEELAKLLQRAHKVCT
jgi:ribonuclease P protein component